MAAVMHNFLNHKLKPNVIASCPETDGYEVENLISDNELNKSKGFIAYSAIRPPVNVDFVLICPIKLNYLLLWTSVGAQKSIGIELQAKNSNCDYVTIGKTQTEAPGIVFYNRKHLQKHPDIPKDFKELHCKSCHYLNTVEKIRIRIFRTLNSVPCIGKIEVWGEVSQICSNTTKNTIQQLINGRTNQVVDVFNQPSSSKTQISPELDFKIPEEFIDPISCEIMCLPMTLPSGKTVDQSTLEKHQQSEAKWGRSPSDPFTGQVFTPLRKAILNTALKSRIDTFLLQNAANPNTFQLQRTVGKRIENEIKNKNEEEDNETEASTSDDLDTIISKAMKKYKIIRYSLQEASDCKIVNNCGNCKTENNLYNLNCCHFLCRNCLLNFSDSYCKICNTVFAKSNVKKFHS